MKKTFLLILFSTLVSYTFAQTNLSGIINRYAAVTAIDTCLGALTVQNAAGFEVGNRILIVQMKGATINTSNNNTFGNITNLRNAGKYERARIRTVNGNQIVLEKAILNTYNLDGAVQIVSIPTYENATVTDTLTAQNWNGQTGGILALEVTNTLTLNAPISVNHKGFRGGIAAISQNNNCNSILNSSAYFYELNNWRGAAKGEGIAPFTTGREAGRGAQANGGGGGNDHNAGGGGGAHTAAGGRGGDNEEPDNFGCDGQSPGIGGVAIAFSDNRLFMGGGGGAGHENNDVATNGGNGGGILFLIAKTISGNRFSIMANGETPDTTSGDGGGGGGAGGTILLDVKSVTGPFLIETRGGDGATINNVAGERCHGPGGGGGGGRFLVDTTMLIDYTLARGEAGQGFNSRVCPNGTNGAQPGKDGFMENLKPIPQSDRENAPPTVVTQPQRVSICVENPFQIAVTANGTRLRYQWQLDKGDGAGFQNIAEGGIYLNTQTATLSVRRFSSEFSNYTFRVQILSDCFNPVLSQPIPVQIRPTPTAQFTYIVEGNSVRFNNTSTNGDTYFWNFGDGTTGVLQNPSHTYTQSGTYIVQLKVVNACDSSTSSQMITLTSALSALFSADTTQGCSPLQVTFQNTSSANATNFTWTLPGAIPAFSAEKNPTVTYNTAGKFAVTLVASNASGLDTFSLDSFIVIRAAPTATFTTSVNNLFATFNNTSTNADTYLWEFGDGKTSTNPNPQHIYEKPDTYTVKLTATNACGSRTFTRTFTAGAIPQARFTANRPNGCAPHTVTFNDVSSGIYESRTWEFPGGNPSTSTETNPRVVYNSPGRYDVKLIINGTLGNDTIVNAASVNVVASPTPAFTFETQGNTLRFTNASLNATSYFWTFGNESTSTLQNPTHTFATSGVYTVTLNASNAYCGRSVSRVVAVGLNAIEDLQESGMLVFPNPTQNNLTINAAAFGKPLHLKLYNLEGKILFQQDFSQQLNVDLSAFGNGLYLLQLQSEEKIWVTKIVKQ